MVYVEHTIGSAPLGIATLSCPQLSQSSIFMCWCVSCPPIIPNSRNIRRHSITIQVLVPLNSLIQLLTVSSTVTQCAWVHAVSETPRTQFCFLPLLLTLYVESLRCIYRTFLLIEFLGFSEVEIHAA